MMTPLRTALSLSWLSKNCARDVPSFSSTASSESSHSCVSVGSMSAGGGAGASAWPLPPRAAPLPCCLTVSTSLLFCISSTAIFSPHVGDRGILHQTTHPDVILGDAALRDKPEANGRCLTAGCL